MIDIKKIFYEFYSIKKCFLKYYLSTAINLNIKYDQEKLKRLYEKIKLSEKEKIFYKFLNDFDEFYDYTMIYQKFSHLWLYYSTKYYYWSPIIIMYFIFQILKIWYKNKYLFNLVKYDNRHKEIFKDIHIYKFLYKKFNSSHRNNYEEYKEYKNYWNWWINILLRFLLINKWILNHFQYFFIFTYFIQYQHYFVTADENKETKRKSLQDEYSKLLWIDKFNEQDIKFIKYSVDEIFKQFV